MFFPNFVQSMATKNNKPTLYNILEVDNNATTKEIKKAYRKLATECHPDKCNGDKQKEDQFKLINEAYEILSDTDKRTQYDMFGSTDNMPGMPGMPGMPFNMSTFSIPIDPNMFQAVQSDILQSVFGIPSEHTTQPPINLSEISSQQVFEQEIFNSIHNLFGIPTKKQTTMKSVHTKMPTKKITLPITLEDCYNCNTKQLRIHRQVRHTEHEEIIQIQIPKGVKHKHSITFIEKGDLTKEYTVPGDLEITFSINKDSTFKKFGQDIIYEKNILLSEALYGCSFDLTLPNKQHLHFTSSSIITPNQTNTFEQLGFPNEQGQRGTLHILFKVEFPTALVDKQRELLYKLLPKRKNTEPTTNSVYDSTYSI